MFRRSLAAAASAGRVVVGANAPKRKLDAGPAISLVRGGGCARARRRFQPPPAVCAGFRWPLQTDAARDRIKSLLEKKPEALGVRLGVRTREWLRIPSWPFRLADGGPCVPQAAATACPTPSLPQISKRNSMKSWNRKVCGCLWSPFPAVFAVVLLCCTVRPTPAHAAALPHPPQV